MQLHNWMVKYTPQTVWIQNKGIFVWLSLYAGILGGGAYLVALVFDSHWGMFISWLIIVFIKGGLHIAHAERPSKLWMMVLKPKTSWISRGLIITLALAVAGATQLAFSFWLPGTVGDIFFKVLTGFAAFGVILYAGLALSNIPGIPFWNSAALPILFILWGLLCGFGLVMVINSVGWVAHFRTLITGNLILLIVLIITQVLFLWTTRALQSAGKESAREILQGKYAVLFWVGVIAIGLALPLIISAIIFITFQTPSPLLTVIIFISALVGSLSATYCIMKAGYYRPLFIARV
ncbi:MAG: polysulfide reductase NrfD [Dehalococcoidales bacterium]|nr:polysulfide reductase NrfD [Dehalococcoidales bacterium]